MLFTELCAICGKVVLKSPKTKLSPHTPPLPQNVTDMVPTGVCVGLCVSVCVCLCMSVCVQPTCVYVPVSACVSVCVSHGAHERK